MPKGLIHFFEGRSLKFHLIVALLLGLLFRLLSAYFAYGPLAMDDFVDGVTPAIQLAHGTWPTFNVGRSYLLVWLLTVIIKIGQFFGYGHSGVEQIRSMYGGLGLLSLGTIVGAYYYVRKSSDKTFAALTLYLVSLYWAMPFLGTRTFGETASMPWILLGIGLLQDSKNTSRLTPYFFAFLFLGVASFFRFQNGILLLTCIAIVLYERNYVAFRAAVLAGIVALVLEAGIDLLSHRYPYQTFFEHVFINRNGGQEYGSQPWFTHLTLLTLCTLPPLCLVFADKIVSAIRKNLFAFWPLVTFVLVHTCIAHKEERYMSPVLGLLLILLAAVWAEKKDSSLVRRLYAPAFLALNCLLLFVASFSNSQGAFTSPIVDVQAQYHSGIFVDTNTSLGENYYNQYIYRNPGFSFMKARLDEINPNYVDHLLHSAPQAEAVVILAAAEIDNKEPLRLLENTHTEQSQCSYLHSAASITDRVIYKLNPKRNFRRRPIDYVVCEPRPNKRLISQSDLEKAPTQ